MRTSTQVRPPLGKDLLVAARRLSGAATAGLLGGLLFGGLGGRLAMLILRLTSDPSLHGLETDDGFTIGVVSTETFFLVIITAITGVFGGLVYVGVRSWLPRRARSWLFGTLTGLVGGALVIRPDGIDFTRLEPLWLAVAMFVALPFGYGVVVSILAEWFLRPDSAFRTSRVALVGLVAMLPMFLFGLFGLAIILLAIIAFAVWHWAPDVASVLSSGPATWVGRSILAIVGVAAAVELVQDAFAIL